MFTSFYIFHQLICLHPTGVPFTYPRQAVFFVKLYNRYANTSESFVDLFLVGMRTLPYGVLAAFDPVSLLHLAARQAIAQNLILTVIFTGTH